MDNHQQWLKWRGKLQHMLKWSKDRLLENRTLVYLSLLLITILLLPLYFNSIFDSAKEARRAEEIVFITTNSPTTYFRGKDGELSGPEYDLARAFASSKNLRANFKTYDTEEEMISALESKEGDIIAGGLSESSFLQKKFSSSVSYQQVKQVFLCHPQVPLNNNIPDWANHKLRISISNDSYFKNYMNRLLAKWGNIKFTILDESSNEELIKMVSERRVDCTVTDSTTLKLYTHFFPELLSFEPIESQRNLVWYFLKRQSHFKVSLKDWFASIKQNGTLNEIMDRYYGAYKQTDAYDAKIFLERIKNKLPEFRSTFEKYGKMYDIPWTFLAAVSYQESHWDPLAKSPTGVRGLMMLTKGTAGSMNVKNRLDVDESVSGGARYIAELRSKIPDYFAEDDRLYMAMAMYNVGLAHLQDARALAVWQNRNPNRWSDIADMLPLLSIRKYYKMVPYGQARGTEPVIYVQRIRGYYELLKHQFNIAKESYQNSQKKIGRNKN